MGSCFERDYKIFCNSFSLPYFSEHNIYCLVADCDCVGISCAAGRLVFDRIGRFCGALAWTCMGRGKR